MQIPFYERPPSAASRRLASGSLPQTPGIQILTTPHSPLQVPPSPLVSLQAVRCNLSLLSFLIAPSSPLVAFTTSVPH